MKIIQSLLIIILLVTQVSGNSTQNKTQNEDKITGFGPIGGDLILPRSSIIYQEKLFVLDQYGLSLFNLETRQFIKRFPNDSSYNDVSFWNEPGNWINTFSYLSKGFSFLLMNPFNFCDPESIPNTKPHFRNEMNMDSADNIYILIKNKFIVFNIKLEKFVKTIEIQEEVISLIKNQINYFTFHIYKDKIYLLKITTNVLSYVIKSEVFMLDLDGKLFKRVMFDLPLNEKYHLSNPDFILIEKDHIFCLILERDAVTTNAWESFSPVLFFDENGFLLMSNKLQYAIEATGIEYIDPNTLALFGNSYPTNDPSAGCFCLMLITYSYDNQEVVISTKNYITSEDFGLVCLDLHINNKQISLITSGYFREIWEFQSFLINDSVVNKIGSNTNSSGQIISSFAFSIDPPTRSLFTSNLNTSSLNRFNEIGKIENQMKLERSTNIYQDNLSLFTSTISSMYCIDSETIITSYYNSGNINRHSLTNGKYDELFINYDRSKNYCWIDIHRNKESLLFLDLQIDQKQNPILYQLDLKEDTLLKAVFFSGGKKKFANPPLFLGFTITDSEYQFLDCVHQSVWVYDYKKKLKEIVQLPQDQNGFYSSFDLYPDGSWIVTDVTQHRLLHIARNGELLEIIGSKGQVEIGTTKEAYLEKPNQFYFPIRAKIANNNIYVSDFGNCRYHVIPIEPLAINWKEKSIQHENVSIFSSESGSLHYDISAPSILSYEVSSTVPWLTLPQQNGSLADKQIDYQIIGEKLTPWQTHQGEIRITFPDQWSFLNHTIPVSVYAIGSTVELMIGSNQAKVDGKWISMELGYIPVIKQGRTCIGIRFLTEYLFRSHATIEYESDTQRIKLTTKEHTIYMMINHDIASVDGKSITLDVPPFIQQGRTMIPLRFVSESLEAEVSWEASTQKVMITYPKKGK